MSDAVCRYFPKATEFVALCIREIVMEKKYPDERRFLIICFRHGLCPPIVSAI